MNDETLRRFFTHLENQENQDEFLYPKGFAKQIVTIMKHDAEEFISVLGDWLSKVELNENALKRPLAELFYLLFSQFASIKIRRMRENPNQKYMDLLDKFDIIYFKDFFQTVQDFDEVKKFLDPQLGNLSDVEEKYLAILIVMFTGIADSSDAVFRMYVIRDFLLRFKLDFKYESFLFLLGINDHKTLNIINQILDQEDVEIEDIFRISLSTKDKNEEKGCPFVLFSPKTVKQHIKNISVFAQRVIDFGKQVSTKQPGNGLDFMFKEFMFEREELLKSQFVKQV